MANAKQKGKSMKKTMVFIGAGLTAGTALGVWLAMPKKPQKKTLRHSAEKVFGAVNELLDSVKK